MILSIAGFTNSPTLGLLGTLGGYSVKSVTPTTNSSSPNAKTVSARLGERQTMGWRDQGG